MSVPAAAILLLPGVSVGAEPAPDAPADDYAAFPSQAPKLVREMVGAAHRDLEKVTKLLADAPQLANAVIDWGFGDWETALGAASHTGRREIAEVLLQHGARPDIFCAAMLGQIDVVKAMITARPGLQKTRGPHGLSLLHHARAGDEASKPVFDYLAALGDADPSYTDIKLSDAQRDACIGEYSYGPAAPQRFEVIVPKRFAQLAIQREGESSRNLFHQGNHSFIPAGGNDVRVVFEMNEGSKVTVTVLSPQHILTAVRIG